MTKIAVVTGASRGFGRGIAFVLATEANYKVYVTARNKVALTKLKEEVDSIEGSGEVVPFVLDQSDDDAVIAFAKNVSSSEDKIDSVSYTHLRAHET